MDSFTFYVISTTKKLQGSNNKNWIYCVLFSHYYVSLLVLYLNMSIHFKKAIIVFIQNPEVVHIRNLSHQIIMLRNAEVELNRVKHNVYKRKRYSTLFLSLNKIYILLLFHRTLSNYKSTQNSFKVSNVYTHFLD